MDTIRVRSSHRVHMATTYIWILLFFIFTIFPNCNIFNTEAIIVEDRYIQIITLGNVNNSDFEILITSKNYDLKQYVLNLIHRNVYLQRLKFMRCEIFSLSNFQILRFSMTRS